MRTNLTWATEEEQMRINEDILNYLDVVGGGERLSCELRR